MGNISPTFIQIPKLIDSITDFFSAQNENKKPNNYLTSTGQQNNYTEY